MRDSDHLTSTLAEAASSVKTKHTPGPWEHDSYCESIYSATGYRIADIPCVDPGNRVTQDANARLIATAPELLEALQKIAAYEPLTFAECSDAEAVIGLAKDAIAKATGESA